MTVYEILEEAAQYFSVEVADLTLASGTVALNQARRNAELRIDFEFSRVLAYLEIDGSTGGSLDDAVVYGTQDEVSPTAVEIKSPVEVGLFDEQGNLRPIDWTTVAESLERQRIVTPGFYPRYPTDGQIESGLCALGRLAFSGQMVYLVPRNAAITLKVGIECYKFWPDWTTPVDATDTQTNVWTTKGSQYLLWQTIVQLNHLHKHFVFRQEGNLPPPQELANAGLEALITWDINRYEQFRRHQP